ncbi:hypothetical protein AVEN_146664-1 [Araneus ventricosus]|uniref:Uncharacterized protein n=1 Tax=Araneus ventricosus TaxID=182803 RepID=A0A4Y2KMI7_ARAVE|nr:hypothetical protein AVEN_146664-1 [Araneus ventricosus]
MGGTLRWNVVEGTELSSLKQEFNLQERLKVEGGSSPIRPGPHRVQWTDLSYFLVGKFSTVVFDASAKTTTDQSLNSILLNGGSIQDALFSLVTRFRTHIYAFTADIQKMYRQILVEPSQRDLQRIVWKETNN